MVNAKNKDSTNNNKKVVPKKKKGFRLWWENSFINAAIGFFKQIQKIQTRNLA